MAVRPATLMEALVGDALSVDGAGIPADVRHKAGACLLDFLAACLEGSSLPWSVQAVEAALALGASGQCTVLASGQRVAMGEAAFANAVLGGSTSQMDTLADSAAHPGVVILPALLAAAEQQGHSGGDLLAGIVAGYQVMARLGRMMYYGATRFSARPTGVLGPVAAAAGLARMSRLTSRQTVNALALAANTGAGLMEWAHCGTMDLVFHAATASRNGLTSWRLALAGAEAAGSALDGPSGLISTFASVDLARAQPAAWEQRYEILEAAHKPVPACVFVQSPCQAALAIVRRRQLDIADIDSIRIMVHPMAKAYPGCDNPTMPGDPQAARMSIQYSVASVLCRKTLSASNWTQPASAQIGEWLAKCRLVGIENLQGVGKCACVVEVGLHDGSMLRESADDFTPASTETVRRRFLDAAQRMLSPDMPERIIGWADDLRSLRSIGPLMQAMCVRR